MTNTGYSGAGVDTGAEELAMAGLKRWVEGTFALRQGQGKVLLPIGYFANVIDLGGGLGLAISTDGVGSKVLVAQLMHRYDTVGIDCIAMNVNDLICVGAEPLAMVDCISVQQADPRFLEDIAIGLARGAELSNITIPGGEIAQVRELINGVRDGYGFDLVGTAVGVVQTDKIIVGKDVVPGDVIVGVASSGIHSNGLTLARRVLFEQAGLRIEDTPAGLGRSIGAELLEPTAIYVKPVVELLKSGAKVKSLSHITSDGLLNLARIEAGCGFVVETLPEPPAIFELIAKHGHLPVAEMYAVFNMGVGFCVVMDPADAQAAIATFGRHGFTAWTLGHAVADPERKVTLAPLGLAGTTDRFEPV